eukprot:gnl/TRDRNA2_/TRDRNA2_154175_c0_seq1.p1 gnl/TRDRNA2_/TRDRNA2_154175_c0~~gnl/TRDRNA2_/TRDRNA2_154175_c0_seq1.p1  ORF type:complete len:610 (-),score=89.96 gnl/TRDRNA2_/TRDRNA2_154175_c0_seq1:68-1897(-)
MPVATSYDEDASSDQDEFWLPPPVESVSGSCKSVPQVLHSGSGAKQRTNGGISGGNEDFLLASLPGTIWERLLMFIGEPCVVSRAAVALLADQSMRVSALADDALWKILAGCTWGPSWATAAGTLARDDSAQTARSWRHYVRVAADGMAARLLWAACGHVVPHSTPSTSPMPAPATPPLLTLSGSSTRRENTPWGSLLRSSMDYEVSVLRANDSLVAAASHEAAEVRLFRATDLSRLPPLHLKTRASIDAIDVMPEHDVLAVGTADGQVCVHAVSDVGGCTRRVARFGGAVAQTAFAGLHFVTNSAGGHILVAVKGSLCAQLMDVSRAQVLDECHTRTNISATGDGGLLACEPLGRSGAALLVDACGCVRIWDVRAPGHAAGSESRLTLDLALHPDTHDGRVATAVDLASNAAVVVTGGPSPAVHWMDLRAGRVVRARPGLLWPSVFDGNIASDAGSAPVRVALARYGFVAAWFDGPVAPIVCHFGGGPSLAPLCAGAAAGTATAVARPFGGEANPPPLTVAIARPSRRKLLYELCAPGSGQSRPLVELLPSGGGSFLETRAPERKAVPERKVPHDTPPLRSLMHRRHSGNGGGGGKTVTGGRKRGYTR